MRYGSDKSLDGANPFAVGAAGAVGGGAAVLVGQKIQAANRKANWALGIGVVLTALSAISSSDLNANQSTAAALAGQAQAMNISLASTATLATLTADVQGLRAHQVAQDNLMGQIAYSANWWAFGGAPLNQTAVVQAGPITPAAVTTSSNNNSIIIVAFAALVVLLAVIL